MVGNPRAEKSIYTAEYAAVLRLLKAARERAGLSQVDMAERIGVTQSQVSKIERGDRRLDIVQLRTILRHIGVPLPRFAEQLEREIARK